MMAHSPDKSAATPQHPIPKRPDATGCGEKDGVVPIIVSREHSFTIITVWESKFEALE
jgi:hypothetical protein